MKVAFGASLCVSVALLFFVRSLCIRVVPRTAAWAVRKYNWQLESVHCTPLFLDLKPAGCSNYKLRPNDTGRRRQYGLPSGPLLLLSQAFQDWPEGAFCMYGSMRATSVCDAKVRDLARPEAEALR